MSENTPYSGNHRNLASRQAVLLKRKSKTRSQISKTKTLENNSYGSF